MFQSILQNILFAFGKHMTRQQIHLMQSIKLKTYDLICLTMDTTMYLLMRNLYSQMLPSKEP